MSDLEKVINDLQMQIEELEERLAIVLEGQPEIVRCKECKHNTNTIHNPICGLDAYRSGGTDWFCADGKRENS